MAPAPAEGSGTDAGVAADVPQVDTGLQCLGLLFAFHELPVELDHVRQECGVGPEGFDAHRLVEAARRFGLKSKLIRTSWRRLRSTPLPAIAELEDGRFVVLAKMSEASALIQDPKAGRAQAIERAAFERAWTGRLILLARRADATETERPFGFGWFVPSLTKYRALLGQVMIASLVIQIFGLATPMFTMVVMDKVLVSNGLTTLDVMVIGLVAVGLFEFATNALRNYLSAHVSNKIDVVLAARVFAHMARLPTSYFASRPIGATAARVRETEVVRNFLTGATTTVLLDLAFSVVYLLVMHYYAPLLTWIVIGVVAALLLLYGAVAPFLKERLQRKANGATDNQVFLVETVAGIETAKSLAVEPYLQRRWEEQAAAQVTSAFQADQLNSTLTQTVALMNRLMVAVTLWLGARMVIQGDLTAGQLVAFNMLAGRVVAPAQRLAQLWQQLQQTRVSVQRLGDIMNTKAEVERAGATSLPRLDGRITFVDVSFRYGQNNPEVLRDIALDVAPGQVIGVVGSSGSGKSTLVKLIQRLHVPDKGKILIDGIDVALVDPRWLRRQVGTVLQDNFLFNRSVRENIAIADPLLSMERIEAVAKLVGADQFIRELPQAYDTIVGERGQILSTGQRQRIAFARALATDPRILILDEATSALDAESEYVIQQNLRRIAAGRTVVIVAHRLSTLRIADRIVVLERGRIVEDGPAGNLIAQGGRFATLRALQIDALEPANTAGAPVAGAAGT